MSYLLTIGRAVAQAISLWLPTAGAWGGVWEKHMGFMVDRATLRQIFSEYFGFSRQSSFYQFLHHHNHQGLAQ
jgi:hypothetical protein